MARIRSAKPEFWTDPVMCAMKRDIRFTFKGLWEVSADDDGRFQADPRLIKGQVWPLDDDLTVRKIDGFLTQLADAGRIQLYEVAGARYGVIVNWHRHQKISHPTPSKLPPPPGNAPVPLRSDSGNPPERFRPDREMDVDGDVEMERDEEAKGLGERRERRAAPRPIELPPRALAFARHFYGDATPERKREVFDQLVATLNGGARLKRGVVVRAFSPEHLDERAGEVMREGVDDPDKAIVVLLKKLGDIAGKRRDDSDSHTGRLAAAVKHTEREQLAELDARKARAAEWERANPEHAARIHDAIAAQLGAGSGVFMTELHDTEFANRVHALGLAHAAQPPPAERTRPAEAAVTADNA